MTRILVVDDEPQLLRALQINLRAHGYQVRTAPDGTQALRSASNEQPDVVILDLGLPDMEGSEVIRGLRGWSEVPIIVLSGRSESGDKVRALDAGADDYVTKPFGMAELLARVRAVTRRGSVGATTPAVVHIGDSMIDLSTHRVQRDGTDIHLTKTEWRLLEILLRNPGKLVTGRYLLTQVWGPSDAHQTQYLRQYLAQLRRKLEPTPSRPQYLLTESGIGYRFVPH